MPVIEYETTAELQAIAEQLKKFDDLQRHAKRLCVGGVKNFESAIAALTTIKTDTQPGGALTEAAVLSDGWMVTMLEIDGQPVSIDAALTELIAKYAAVADYMAAIQAAYAAIGGGEFFPGL